MTEQTMGKPPRPNVLFVLADQLRAQATGYAGDSNAFTPAIDRLHGESISFTTAVSSTPVCCPTRASLLTGQYPLTHGLFMNDVPLGNRAGSLAQAFAAAALLPDALLGPAARPVSDGTGAL